MGNEKPVQSLHLPDSAVRSRDPEGRGSKALWSQGLVMAFVSCVINSACLPWAWEVRRPGSADVILSEWGTVPQPLRRPDYRWSCCSVLF